MIDGRATANLNVLSNKLFDLNKSIGRTALNSMYPDEFEVYFLSLELVDSSKKTQGFFTFPVNPQQLSRTNKAIKTIEKTQFGINVEKNSTFAPINITIEGNFGRSFKLLIGKEKLDFKAILTNAKKDKEGNQFSENFKTGFGCFKALDKLIKKSKGIDDFGKPYSLILFNPIFSESHIVEVTDFTVKTNSSSSNMLHQYSMNLVAVAPISAYASDKDELDKIKKSQNKQIQNKLIADVAFQTAKNVANVLRVYGDDARRKVISKAQSNFNETKKDIRQNGLKGSKVGKEITFLTQKGTKFVKETGKGISSVAQETFKKIQG